MSQRSTRRRAARAAAATSALTWTPFEQATDLRAPGGVPYRAPDGMAVYRNALYTVTVRAITAPAPFGRGFHLSVKRNDRAPLHDWRHLQRIVNELVGPEAEAVELYPAESRKVDGANQYHLWAFPGYAFPFGQHFREVCTPDENAADSNPFVRAAVQRPFEAGDPWNASTGAVSARGPLPVRRP